MVASSMISLALFIAVTSRFFAVGAAQDSNQPAPVWPTEPIGATNYTAGSTCHIAWKPATQPAPADWKNMKIQLMSGSNMQMVPLETVATSQDGSAAGTFDHKCPEVSENARIYFYQFTCEGCTTAWTTRFMIAGADGKTVEPDHDGSDQLDPDGKKIPWGTGTIVSSGGSPTDHQPKHPHGNHHHSSSSSSSAGPTATPEVRKKRMVPVVLRESAAAPASVLQLGSINVTLPSSKPKNAATSAMGMLDSRVLAAIFAILAAVY
ncbi:hypothetical protein C8J56DRAFT_355500 [Mycena floridula]|nr:hypothetical protein C8J56DRAFT_355500 [Mycena floridula]